MEVPLLPCLKVPRAQVVIGTWEDQFPVKSSPPPWELAASSCFGANSSFERRSNGAGRGQPCRDLGGVRNWPLARVSSRAPLSPVVSLQRSELQLQPNLHWIECRPRGLPAPTQVGSGLPNNLWVVTGDHAIHLKHLLFQAEHFFNILAE